MKHNLFKRFGSGAMAGIILLGILLGCVPALLYITATAADEPMTISFTESYAVAGQELHVEVANASGSITYLWTVDGLAVGTDSATYTPTEADLMNWISVTATCGDERAETKMFFSKLPVVYIDTVDSAPIVSKETYIDANLKIQGNETYNSSTTKLYNGLTEIRGRGNSTWGQPKKPYRLKLDKKTDLFGMGKSKHWVLLANYMDESLQRNTLAYNLSGAMGMEQMSTVYVDVILNGEFVGNYQLCENVRVDSNRVDIFDWETYAEDCAGVIGKAEGLSKSQIGDLEEYMAENMGWITSGTVTFNGSTYNIADYPDIEIPSINGGYILELDEYFDEVSKFRTDGDQPMMFKNPEFVYSNQDMMDYVQGYVQAFEDAVQSDSYSVDYNGKTLHYSELYDMDALVDYWLITEIFFNEEINKKSTYMYKDIDGLMMMGPIWDMDWSSGADQGSTYLTNQWATLYFSTNAQAQQWYKFLVQDPYFMVRAQERYWEIRNNEVADMLDELESNYTLLKESAYANQERWGHQSFDGYTNTLRNWLNNHLAWMDDQMETQSGMCESLGNKINSSLTMNVTDANGGTLAADTAKTAPADFVMKEGESLRLTISWAGGGSGTATLFVNGRSVNIVSISSSGTATMNIPADILTASTGEKNVLEVKVYQNSYVEASAFLTVLETE